MAEIRDEKGKAGEVPNATACGCGGNPPPVRKQESDSIRGAAIALCMSVDELKELLRGEKPSESKDDEDDLREKVKQLRAEVAFLKSENYRLNERLTALRVFTDKSFVIRF